MTFAVGAGVKFGVGIGVAVTAKDGDGAGVTVVDKGTLVIVSVTPSVETAEPDAGFTVSPNLVRVGVMLAMPDPLDEVIC